MTGRVRAYDLLRMFGREGRPIPLGQAFAEYGRIAKTLHLLRVVDLVDDPQQAADEPAAHRPGVAARARSRHLPRQARTAHAAVLWTTRYLDSAVDHLRGLPPRAGARRPGRGRRPCLPLKDAILNCLGHYGFAAHPPREGLRPLRDPVTVHLDEDYDGREK